MPAAGQEVEKGSRIRVEVNRGGAAAQGAETDISNRASISASSVMLPDASYINYNPYNLVDNGYTTCWAEGNPGYGINDWIKVAFPQEVVVTKISFLPGYLKTSNGKDRWLQNGRLKIVDISFDDGTTINHTFQDTKNFQDVILDKPVKTRNIMIIIRDVYPGQPGPNWKVAEDTSVSEIHVYGYLRALPVNAGACEGPAVRRVYALQESLQEMAYLVH
ncbi:MAG: discoidin domain-containing protein [Actinomycetota bacterium]